MLLLYIIKKREADVLPENYIPNYTKCKFCIIEGSEKGRISDICTEIAVFC